MTHVTCRLTAKNRVIGSGTLRSVIEYGLPLPFTRVSRYQNGKTNLDFTEARDSEWQCISWVICKSAPRSRQITTPAPHPTTHFFTGRMPFVTPNQQRQSTEGRRNAAKNLQSTYLLLGADGMHRSLINAIHTCIADHYRRNTCAMLYTSSLSSRQNDGVLSRDAARSCYAMHGRQVFFSLVGLCRLNSNGTRKVTTWHYFFLQFTSKLTINF